MDKKKKIPLIILAVLGVLSLVVVLLSSYVKKEVKLQLDEVLGPESTYGELDIDLLQRKMSLTDIDYVQKGNRLTAKKVAVSGIGIYEYVVNGKVEINKLEIIAPDYLVTGGDSSTTKSSKKQQQGKEVLIKKIRTRNGVFRYREKDSSQNAVFVSFPQVNLNTLKYNKETAAGKIPFSYKDYDLKIDSLRVNMNPEHYISIGDLTINDGATDIHDFRIVPYYGKSTFDKKVPYEKDRISLQVNRIQLDSLQVFYENDSLHVENNLMQVRGGNLQIYRNKLLSDDIRGKALYAEMLRKAPVKLNFRKVTIDSSLVEYEEKTSLKRPVARVGFYDIKGTVNNILNTQLEREDFPRTTIKASANFMHVAPVSIDWSFSVPDPNNEFLISGKFGSINGEQLNSFLRPSMGVEAKGRVEDLYFTFTGTEEVLIGDVRLQYDNFKVVLLKKGGKEEKGFLSAIVNLFVDNDGADGEAKEKEIRMKRVKNRSFWSYVWSGIRKGLRKSFTQL